MDKSPDAFRTISEVADWLDVPTHVLRFWESRFAQVKPVKRAGGRRYYRPNDMRLIGGIKTLLHDEGMTIRGVQKLLREQGIKHVSGFSQPLDHETLLDDEPPAEIEAPAEVTFIAKPRHEDEVLTLEDSTEPEPATHEDQEPLPFEAEAEPEPEAPSEPAPVHSEPEPALAGAIGLPAAAAAEHAPQPDPEPVLELEPAPIPEPQQELEPEPEILQTKSAPIVADVPDHDPQDDDPAFAMPAGALARLIFQDRNAFQGDAARLEEVVSALRAVRDRSAS